MPYPPFPSMYNPFLVKEPEYTAQQQNKYPQMTGDIQAQLSDANRMNDIRKFSNVSVGGIDINQQPDPLYSSSNIGSQIKPREYNQPNALQERLANIPSIIKNIEDANSDLTSPNDMGGAGVMANTGPEPTSYLDQIMGKSDAPYVMDYTPFSSEEEMNKYYNPRQKEPEIVDTEPEIKLPPAFYGEYEKAKEQSKKEYWQNNKPIEMPFIKFKGPIPNNLDVTNMAKDMPLPKSNTYPNNTSTNPLVQTPKNKFGTPEAYYLGKSMLDASALINNMVQPQPPSIQMKNTYFERQKLNPEPYDIMRSEMRNQGTQAYRLQRENISQASDLMKGLAAVTSGTQQGLMQVGMQQAAAEQQVQNINQQISAQEQAGIAQTQNQETMTNYQIQAQAQQFKDQMVSAQLARLGDTAGAYAKYSNMKDIASKQEMINKSAIQSTNEIQNAMLQWQMHKDAKDSDEYKSTWAQHWNKSLNKMATDKVSDEKYNLVKEYYGTSTPNFGDYNRRATNQAFVKDYYQKKNSSDMFQKLYPGGVAPDKSTYSTEQEYNSAVADYQRYKDDYGAYTGDKSYKMFEQEQDFWSAIGNEKNENEERKNFEKQYMLDRGYYDSEKLMEVIKTSLDRSRQSLGIGG